MNSIKCKGLYSLSLLLTLLATGCDKQVYDDLEPCPTSYHLKFRYDYNIKDADAFPKEVGSVAVWAFDSNGHPVWRHTEDLTDMDRSARDGYSVEVPLAPGKYDFVTWCGLTPDSRFRLDKDNPGSMSDLGMTLTLSGLTKAEESTGISNAQLPGLYHGIKRGVEITSNPAVATDNEIGLSLTKDTNYFKILLQNLDGSVMGKDDFSFYITGGNTRLEHDNSVGGSDGFHYHPWSVTSAEATLEGSRPQEGVITSVSSVLAELHTSRLMADSGSELVVHRNSDNQDIIRIPLVEYLLLVKGNYRNMTDQEYLDRQDEYALTFFIDKESNWKRTIGIYINAWHVVPPQEGTIH